MVQSKRPKIFRNETSLPGAFSFPCTLLLSARLQPTKGFFSEGNSSETLGSWRRSQQCSLATKLGESPSPLENSTFSPRDQEKLPCSLQKQPWPKFLTHDSFSNFVSSCAVRVEFLFNIMCFRLFFCRYLLTEDEWPKQEIRKARAGMCFSLVSSTAGTNRHSAQNLPRDNSETAQDIWGSNLCSYIASCETQLDSHPPWTRGDPSNPCQRQHGSGFAYQLIQDWLWSRQRRKCRRKSLVLALISLSETIKKKIRLILVYVSENVWFNSSVCGTPPVQFHPSVTHTEPSCSKNRLQLHSCCSSWAKNTPFLLHIDYFRCNL